MTFSLPYRLSLRLLIFPLENANFEARMWKIIRFHRRHFVCFPRINSFKAFLSQPFAGIQLETRSSVHNYASHFSLENSGEISPDTVKDIGDLFVEIKKELSGRDPELCKVAEYYFDGQGKAIRPLIVVTMSRAINSHINGPQCDLLLPNQKQLALAIEMIHTATLVHDDVIDRSNKRRGKSSVNVVFGENRTILSGDYIMAKAGAMVARLENDEMIELFAQILEDLVHGEFMQLETASLENPDRFSEYIRKTYNKTASLMAHSCKGAAILGGASETFAENAFQYGKHLGIAFQIMDDLLDFVSSTSAMGKPVVADLQLGLATAPVLFAAEKFSELVRLIERKFSKNGDVLRTLEFVRKSDGLEKTKKLAEHHCEQAVKFATSFKPSVYQQDLIRLTKKVLCRSK